MSSQVEIAARLNGVFPVLPTPFHEDGTPDAESLARLVQYLIESGVQGMTYPGVASEVGEVSLEERIFLTELVVDNASQDQKVVVGGSA